MAHKPAVEGLEADGRRATRRLREAPPGALLIPRLLARRRLIRVRVRVRVRVRDRVRVRVRVRV